MQLLVDREELDDQLLLASTAPLVPDPGRTFALPGFDFVWRAASGERRAAALPSALRLALDGGTRSSDAAASRGSPRSDISGSSSDGGSGAFRLDIAAWRPGGLLRMAAPGS